MEPAASGEVATHLFPALGPALVISMGYIDLGKWLAAVDGGARFGNDLVLLVLFFNLIAIMCQYLATCVGIVTGKSLAEICITEYPGPASMILGVQAEISMITSDLTMILGLSYGFNLLLGINLLPCICLAAAGSVLLPLFLDFLNYWKAEFVCVTVSALALLLYVLGVLISQPEIPLAKNVMFPKLRGESAYSLMALLGANLMAHNFYVHSSIVRQQKRILGVRVGALLHDHFFAILFIFTGISLVNYVLMNSAAVVFGTTDIELNFDDLPLLMDQIFRIPVAPIAIFLLLLFSSQITSSAWNTDGPKLLTYSFGKNVSVREHVLMIKAFSVVPALGFATFGGAEGVYQFLIFCQVVHATLLPSSVIPLFRVASSRSIMGAFKMPWYLEIMALLAFLGMLASNVIFIIEMLFGNSNWINDLRGSVGGIVTFAGILLVACGSIFFTLYLAVTPLKSASDMPETEVGTIGSQKDKLEVVEGREDDIQEKVTTIIDQFALEPASESTVLYNDKLLLESHLDQSDTTFHSDNDRLQTTTDTSGTSDMVVDSDHDSHQPNHGPSASDTLVTPIFQTEELKSINVADLESVNEESANILLDHDVLERERHEFVAMQKGEILDTDLPIDKDTSEKVVPKEPLGELSLPVNESVVDSLPSSTSEDSGLSNIEKVKISDGGVGSGSLSKLSGLGRAARRQLAVTLDEFWGQLFDFYGKPTPEAGAQKYDALLGLEVKNVSSTKVEIGTELPTNLRADVDRGPVFQLNQMEYSSPKLKSLCNADLSYGFQMASSSRSRNMQVLNTPVQNASSSLLEPNERRYSSLYLPQYSNNHDYQPATVHGYHMASYLKEIGAGRNLYSPNVAPESPRISKSGIRVPPGFGDSVPYSDRQNGLGSLATSSLQSPTASRVSRVQVEGPFFGPSSIEPSYNTGPSPHPKKFHSSPDMSALIAASRNYYMNESKLVCPIRPSPSVGRVAAKQQQYLNPISKTGVSSAFDELYWPNLQRNVFSPQPNLNTDTNSFWSRQPLGQPLEQLLGGMELNRGGRIVTEKLGHAPREILSYTESEVKLLQSLRLCISKLLKMEGSDRLFRPNSGCDEELIYLVSTQCKAGVDEINQLDSGELHLSLGSVKRIEEADTLDIVSLPSCGEGCIWRASLVVSFGVWCVHRILELSLAESRPELWGKYTYVLNRLQGILDLAFSKPRETLSVCSCIDVPPEAKPIKGSFTTASTILEIIKDVEIAVSGRKGRTGTAAGDVAFPKGKENLASVLKRYKRRLSNKTTGTQDGSSRKIHTASVS